MVQKLDHLNFLYRRIYDFCEKELEYAGPATARNGLGFELLDEKSERFIWQVYND